MTDAVRKALEAWRDMCAAAPNMSLELGIKHREGLRKTLDQAIAYLDREGATDLLHDNATDDPCNGDCAPARVAPALQGAGEPVAWRVTWRFNGEELHRLFDAEINAKTFADSACDLHILPENCPPEYRGRIEPLYLHPSGESGSSHDAILDAYATWPDDIKRKLSLHDLRRMTGWRPPAAKEPHPSGKAK